MKAVIVEIRDKCAAALSDDGRIYKIKSKNYIIGQRIEVKNQIFNKGNTKFIASIAAACAIFVVPAWAYYTPYSYVSVDINPSIEYSINRFDRVINVNSLNKDGEDILNGINLNDLKNKNIEVAIKKVLDEIIEDGYIAEGECDIVIATSSKNEGKSDELNLKLKSTVEEEIKKETNISNVQVNAITVDNNQVQAAKELGVTPGKLNLVKKLQETAEDREEINIEEWLEKPVKEIVKAQNQYKKELKKEEKTEKKEEKTEKKKEKEAEKENKKEEKIKEKSIEKNEIKEEIKNNKNAEKNDKDNSNKKNSDNEMNIDNKNNSNKNIDNTKNIKVDKSNNNNSNNINKNNDKNDKDNKNNKSKK